ncbi:hypothetical protein NOM80_18660, partial [Proteus mirabilis]
IFFGWTPAKKTIHPSPSNSLRSSDHPLFSPLYLVAQKCGGQTNAVSLTGLGEWFFSQASSRRK